MPPFPVLGDPIATIGAYFAASVATGLAIGMFFIFISLLYGRR